MKTLDELVLSSKAQFDLTDESFHKSLCDLVESLLDLGISVESMRKEAVNAPLEFKLAMKLVESKINVLELTKRKKIGIVYAVWGEHNRLQPKSPENPNGEDSLRVKLQQLNWLLANSPIDWQLYVVDDGDPNNSGKIAADIAANDPLGHHVTVLHLADALPATSGPLANLKSADDSRKGGAIIHGCMKALEDGVDAAVYTDADNSVHLGQLGLLLKPFETGSQVVLGNRKHKDSVLVKQEGRWGVGIKVLRHMQRMVGEPVFSHGIKDTQAAFKLYERSVLEKIIANPTVYDFSFDTDWLMAAIALDIPLTQVPFAFIDSAAESASVTQGPMTTWETLLLGLKDSVRKHHLPHNIDMAKVMDEEIHSAADLELLIDDLPEKLRHVDDAQLGDPSILSPFELQNWIQERRMSATLAEAV